MPIKLAKRLEELGYECQHVTRILNRWKTPDAAVSEFADKADMTLITKDQDFRNSFLLSRKPARLIKVSLGNISNQQLLVIFEKRIDDLTSIHEAY